ILFSLLCYHIILIFFFFPSRRRHTRSKRDWSSDVCSSDLPDNKCGCRSLNSYIPTLLRESSTLFLISLGSMPKFSGPKATSSSTTVATIWLSGFWNTIPAVCLISHNLSSSLVSILFISILPSVGNNIAFRFLDKVDLPEPL